MTGLGGLEVNGYIKMENGNRVQSEVMVNMGTTWCMEHWTCRCVRTIENVRDTVVGGVWCG